MILTPTIRQTQRFQIENADEFRQRALQWSRQFSIVAYLDSNQSMQDKYPSHDSLLAVGSAAQLFKTSQHAFEALRTFYQKHHDWCFGFLAYDLKNDVEALSSKNYDGLGFPDMHFFRPITVLEINDQEVKIHAIDTEPFEIFKAIEETLLNENVEMSFSAEQLRSRITKSDYLETIQKIKQHIIEGDIYEMNFCQEFFAEEVTLDPLHLFQKLNQLSKAPFAAFYKLKDQYLLCASPERFLKKVGATLISQPIKGTIHRGENVLEDLLLKQQLFNSEKDRAENVMIVDLVRNDLARVCEAGSVKVEELFGIYTFEQVHQMISTIRGVIRPEQDLFNALEKSFPMGSMTGAPKVMAMQLIEKYEQSKRGLYSGAVGYITPDGDFDFNVVIRSLFYNEAKKYLSFQVGGAIVYDSTPEQEYEECLLKAKGILQVLNTSNLGLG